MSILNSTKMPLNVSYKLAQASALIIAIILFILSYIFGRDGAKNLAEGMNVPFLGHLPLVQSVREAGDLGRPAVFQENTPIAKAFDELVTTFVEKVKAVKK